MKLVARTKNNNTVGACGAWAARTLTSAFGGRTILGNDGERCAAKSGQAD
jgi:hypothetical protein